MNSIKEEVTQALQDIVQERSRQVESEGWTPEHDDSHVNRELSRAAACYAVGQPDIILTFEGGQKGSVKVWPWHRDWWKPSDARRNLVKAGALILAEIERLDRQATQRDQSQ